MATVGNLIDRLYRTYLEPPDEQPAYATLTSPITDTDLTVQLSNFAVPEDVDLLRNQQLIEIGSELMRVQTVTETPSAVSLEVLRGDEGTTRAAHGVGDKAKLAPSYSRLSVLEAVADNVITLYDKLYSVDTKLTTTAGGSVAPMEDDLAVEVLEVWSEGWPTDHNHYARIVDYHPTVGGRAVILSMDWLGSFWVKYRRRMGRVENETQDLWEEIGVDDRWHILVMVGTAADLLVGKDVSQTHTDWVGKSLQTESIPVGTRTQIATTLASYRDFLLKRFEREMKAEYRTTTRRKSAFRSLSGGRRSGW